MCIIPSICAELYCETLVKRNVKKCTRTARYAGKLGNIDKKQKKYGYSEQKSYLQGPETVLYSFHHQ